ncbi:MAG: TPM domain-containing protein [Desulfuromonadaceae bacterium]|nr:TPM domain-containing protein [Desulfuromonadaceae bacterium]
MKNIILIITLILFPLQLMALDAPPLAGRINDQAGMLSPETKQILEQKLAVFERDTSNQIALLTIPSLQGDDIDQFSIRVSDAWKLGQKGKDNGVLLVIAQAEHKVRIEVGMGLQGVLPDITAGRIIRDTMQPHMKSGNFDQGITAAVDSIISATKGEFKGDGQPARKHNAGNSSPSFIKLLLGAAVAAALLGLYSRYLGGAAGAIGLPLATFVAFPGMGLVTLLILAAGGFAAGIFLSMAFSGMLGGGGGGYGGFGGGWGGGSFGGGGGSSGMGDSFSGGGGGFDGGGASGDW